MRPSTFRSSWAFNSPLNRSVGPKTDIFSAAALLIRHASQSVTRADAQATRRLRRVMGRNRVVIRRRGGSPEPANNYVETGTVPDRQGRSYTTYGTAVFRDMSARGRASGSSKKA